MRRVTGPLRHLLAIGFCLAITLWWLSPIIGRLGTAVPGGVPGDNLSFVWNVWWVRYALVHHLPVLSCPLLFYPFGADLTLHTHTLLPALLVSGVANPVAAQNLLVCMHVFLNFAVMYALAYRETRSAMAALTGAVAYGCAPYVSAHLTGHFNLLAAWVLPAVALLTLRVLERPVFSRGALCGLAIGAIAYVDYYYLIYAALLAVLLAIAPALRVSQRATPAGGRWGRHAIVGLLAVVFAGLACGAVVGTTGGGVWHLAGRTVSMRSFWNPLAVAWVAAILAALLSGLRNFRPSLSGGDLRSLWRPIMAAGGALAVVLAPLVARGIHLARNGAYVTQAYRWRSAPAGIDLTTLIAGNPYSALYGRFVTPLYARANVNLVEHVGWLGPGLIGFCIVGLFLGRHQRAAQRWIIVFWAFSLWAIGPFLQFAGYGTALWMPALIVRWLPLVANARIPARAVIVVYFACAVLAAMGAKRLLERRKAWPLLAALSVLLLLDEVPARISVTQLEEPLTVNVLAASTAKGGLLQLPFGLKDGFGEAGSFDPLAMWLQTLHQHPLAGGFVARLPPDLLDRNRRLPVVGPLLRLSGNDVLTEADVIRYGPPKGAQLRALGFQFVLLDRARATPALKGYVGLISGLQQIAEDPRYTLYSVAGPQ
jgi:hypothetical protein